MKIKLIEGEAFPSGYRLNKRITENSIWQSWTCTNEQTGEKNFVRIGLIGGPFNWSEHVKKIEKSQGLVHENINLIHNYGQETDLFYFIEPYLTGYTPFVTRDENFWPVLSQLLDVLDYIHPLGLCHGNLHPQNLLINEEGKLKVTGFGMPSNGVKNHQDFLSPQIRAGEIPDTTDDIYAFGRLLCDSLVEGTSYSFEEIGTPLPDDLRALAKQMTSSSVVDRNLSPLDLKETLAQYFEEIEDRISITEFSPALDNEPVANQETRISTRKIPLINLRIVTAALTGLAIIGIALFELLPIENRSVQTTQSENAKQASDAKPTTSLLNQPPETNNPTPFVVARREHLQKEGESIARDILQLQLELEDHGVFLWAKKEYERLDGSLDNAEDLFRNSNYEAAMRDYTNIREALTALQENMTSILTRELNIGETALARGDYSEALRALTIANAITRADPEIKAKLRRAENLEDVLDLVRQAELAERKASYGVSLDLYSSASNLDPAWRPALQGIKRVENKIKTQRFNDAMSAAFQAIAIKEYEVARSHFNHARSILPDSTAPADGLAQITQAITNDAINEKRDAARTFIANQDWQQAIASYEAALAISDSLDFAKKGLAYAKKRANIDAQLTKFLSDPTLLQSNAELEVASNLLEEALAIEPTSEELQRHITDLSMLTSKARIKIPVIIRSNGKTSVTVRKQANLGNINIETVHLIPGRYTITGACAGYRDVRKNLVLLADQPVPEVLIACTERVR